MAINIDTARRLRTRGLLLPVPAIYETPRLEEIARRQKQLMDEMDDLDREIFQGVLYSAPKPEVDE